MSSASGIDRDAPTPLYEQVGQRICALITDGTFRAGVRLPSERDLCERLGVSRVTIRRALQDLVDSGLLIVSPQRGWFVASVADVMSEPPNALQSFTETGRSLGLTASSEVLSSETRDATIEEAEQLRVAPGAPILHLERLRKLDNRPVALHLTRVPLDLAPALQVADLTTVSIYATLELAGYPPVRSDCDVRAETPLPHDSKYLGTAPLLVIRQVTYDHRMTPIELSEMRYRGDRYRLRTSLQRDPLLRPYG